MEKTITCVSRCNKTESEDWVFVILNKGKSSKNLCCLLFLLGEVVTKDYMDAQLCQQMYFHSSYHLHMPEPYWLFYLYFNLAVTIPKVRRMFEFVGVKVISSPTYNRHVDMYIQPAVHIICERHQKEMIDTIIQKNSRGLIVAGDVQCDSPGHCAKYGSYTFIEQRYSKVLHFELVQGNTFYCFYVFTCLFRRQPWSLS